MNDNPRKQVIKTAKALLVGPNPLPSPYCQENGEEIIFGDSPLKTYVTGVLFPNILIDTQTDIEEDDTDVSGTKKIDAIQNDSQDEENSQGEEREQKLTKSSSSDSDNSDEVPQMQSYKQSAMGITVCLPHAAERVDLHISGGKYISGTHPRPFIEKKADGDMICESAESVPCYFRKPIGPDRSVLRSELPTAESKHIELDNVFTDGDLVLAFALTYRMDTDNGTIYTITLLNKSKSSATDFAHIEIDKCLFQSEFTVSVSTFLPIPNSFDNSIEDNDYKLNSLLYMDVKNFALGHGCAATWDDSTGTAPSVIKAEFMPQYDVKPIKPTSLEGISFDMRTYSKDRNTTIEDLRKLCDAYASWIEKTETEGKAPKYSVHANTIQKQMEKCRKCLARMQNGISLLETDDIVWRAFSLANQAMLMQQLHYNLPKAQVSWDETNRGWEIPNPNTDPNPEDDSTWYNKRSATNPNGLIYGKWRPFQIAFLLLNLNSMNDKESDDHGIVDLIWFPTGGGKTEAYLGLTAFSIFLRRLKNPNDAGTAVIMRYTLRLLTAQQYQRAASLICSMEAIRSENTASLGNERITIGMWVGSSVTANKEEDAYKEINVINGIGTARELGNRDRTKNASVMLQCPWCGTSMETTGGKTPGYVCTEIFDMRKKVFFSCANPHCRYHMSDNDFTNRSKHDIPILLYDDTIYANPPTLLFGTVDKFAQLPFKPETKTLFGGDRKNSPPELIIQDELHLISGPLGSTVAIYEMLINRICELNGNKPKIVASTATISHAEEQCNALYDCGEEKVCQFPVQGITYRNCFFAEEKNDEPGRTYVGIFGNATSQAETTINTFAAMAYAGIELDDADRDPYWTNLSYFNSIKELGQISTWCLQDIKERLEKTFYRRRLTPIAQRRYLSESRRKELSSQVPDQDIPKVMEQLSRAYKTQYAQDERRPLDICLATNMIQVGLDISRLGLMTVNGQPKSMSEYIQSTSRVGRSVPGVVFVIYNTSKSRDKSHYEQFQSEHSKLYFKLEPTSVVPFSQPLRERALPAVFVGMSRMEADATFRNDPNNHLGNVCIFDNVCKYILNRVEHLDPKERVRTNCQLNGLKNRWISKTDWKEYDDHMSPGPLPLQATLIYSTPKIRPREWNGNGWEAPTSMRNVDGETVLAIVDPATNNNQGGN